MTSKRSYYDILQVSIKAEPEVIEAAYKRLALKYHPDKNNSVNATEYMQELNEAYGVLHDPRKRAEYDRVMNLSSTPHLSQENPYETQWRSDEEKRKREETERNYQTQKQNKDVFKKHGEGEQQQRGKNKKLLNQKFFLKESNQKLILGILGSFSFILVIVVGMFGIYSTNISKPTVTPAPLPSPTVPLLNAYINISVDLGKNNHPVIVGKTNLPDNTVILITSKMNN